MRESTEISFLFFSGFYFILARTKETLKFDFLFRFNGSETTVNIFYANIVPQIILRFFFSIVIFEFQFNSARYINGSEKINSNVPM